MLPRAQCSFPVYVAFRILCSTMSAASEDCDASEVCASGSDVASNMLQSNSVRYSDGHASGQVSIPPLCKEGRWLPELFFLGSQKAASSSFARDLMTMGVKAALKRPQPGREGECYMRGRGCTWKEFHFFDEWYGAVRQSGNADDMWRDLLAEVPVCPQAVPAWTTSTASDSANLTQSLLADFTPDNIALVPMLNGAPASGTAYGHCRNCRSNVNLPEMLAGVYGGQGKSLSFVLTLREPLSRMQSAWYHAQNVSFTGVCVDCHSTNFTSALSGAVAEARQQPPKYQDWVWRSMIAPQLEAWLYHFDARQFFIIPFLEYVRNGPVKTCHALADWHRRDLQCGIVAGRTTHVNQLDHPKLVDEGIPSELYEAFQRTMDPHNRHLVDVLTRMHAQGATLLSFPRAANAGGIASWLHAGWGGSHGSNQADE